MNPLEKIRAGRREANLRLLNERIAEASERFVVSDATPNILRLMCECAHEDCTSTIDLPADVYERLREQTGRFIVIDGHVVHDVEDIVEQGSGWMLVEKRGPAAQEARRVLE